MLFACFPIFLKPKEPRRKQIRCIILVNWLPGLRQETHLVPLNHVRCAKDRKRYIAVNELCLQLYWGMLEVLSLLSMCNHWGREDCRVMGY